jgi:branched-chain amino acid transport system substrate-binding protein
VITKPRLIKVLIAGLCAVFFPVINAPVATANGCTTYSIAYQGPLTGPEAAVGIAQSSAVKFAIGKFKAENPSAPISANLFLADDQGDPALSQAAANSVINQSCVLAVVGPAYSGASRVALPLYKAAALAVITPSAINETLNQYAGGTFFRSARLQKDINIDIMRDVAAISAGATIAYFNSEDSYSANWITSGFQGIKVLRSQLTTGSRVSNAASIKAAYDAGARYFFYDGNKESQNILNFAEDVKTLSASNQLIFSGDTDPLLIKAMYATSINGAWIYPTNISASLLNPTLASEFKSAYPAAQDLFFPESFDAAYFLLQAIAAGATSRSQVSTFVFSKKMAGIAGNLEFAANGDRDYYKSIRLLLSNGNLSIPDSSNLGLNGNFQVSNRVTTTNFKFTVKDWNDSSVLSNRYIVYSSHVQTIESSAITSVHLPNGETTMEVMPSSDSQDVLKRRAIIRITVTAGAVTDVRDVTNPSSPTVYSISGDTYELKLAGFNFVGTISDSGDFSKSIAVISTVQGSTITPVYKVPVVSNNKIFANLDASKTYQIEIYPDGSRYQYHWRTTWSNVSFGSSATLAYTGALQASNIFGKVTTLPITGGTIRVLKKDSSNNWITDFTRSIASTRDFGFYVTPGTEYKIEAIPNSNSVGPIMTSTLTAPATGTITIADLTFTSANVSGSVKSGSINFANSRVYFYRVDDDSEAFNGKTDANGNYSAYLQPGKYYVWAESPSNLYYLNKDVSCTVESVNVNLVCDIEFAKKNVSGRITVNGVGYKSYLYAYKYDAGDGSYGTYGEDYTNDDGTFGMQLKPGTYRIFAQRVITLEDYSEAYVPLGFGQICQVTTAETVCNSNLLPNFKVKLTDSAGSNLTSDANLSFFAPLEESGVVLENFNEVFWQATNRFSSDGIAIPDGTHYVSVSNGSNYGYQSDFSTRKSYKVIVASGVVTSVSDLSGMSIPATNGTYVLKVGSSNFRVKTFRSGTPYNQATITISPRNGLGRSSYRTGTANTFDFRLPQGVYDLTLRPQGNEDPPMGNGRYVVTVDSQGAASMVNSAGESISPQSGFHEISLGTPNLTGLVTLNGVATSAWIEWRKLNSRGEWEWTDAYSEVQSNGKFGGTFEPGSYRPIVYAYNNFAARNVLGPECLVPTTGSVTCNLSIGTENLKFRIKDSENVVQTKIYSNINAVFNPTSSIEFWIGSPNTESGITSGTLFNGNYELFIYQNKNNSSKKYTFDVVNGEVQNFTDTVSKQSVSATNGVFELSFQAPQIKGVIQDSQGNQLAMSKKGLSLNIEKEVNPGQWIYYRNYWISDPSFELRIDEAGAYRVAVNPYQFENYSLTYSPTFYINSNFEASLTSGSGFSSQLSNFNIRLIENNLKFQVLNPIDEKPLTSGYVRIYKRGVGNSETYLSDLYIYSQNSAKSGRFLETGSYRIIVNPWNSSLLDSREYSVSVDANNVVSLSSGTTALTPVDGQFTLYAHKANVFGRLYNSEGKVVSGSSGSVSIQLQQKINGVWGFRGNSTEMSRDGYFGMRVTEPGTYRLAAHPYGKNDVGQTFSSEFEITTENSATFSKEFSPFTLNAPNLRITIGVTDSSTALVGASISVYFAEKSDTLWWATDTNSPDSGLIGLYLPYAGNYQITVRPNESASLLGATTKSYSAVATEGSDGKITVAVTPGTGVSTVSGITRLQLGVANLKGTVTRPNSSEGVSNTYVIPILIKDGEQIELWGLGTNTNASGNFSLTLPEGVYKIRARGPWQSLDYGDSKIIGDITVGSNGTVTSVPTGKQAMSFTIPLSVPTWTGVVKNPAGTTVVPNANLCLDYRVSNNSYAGTCSYTDSLGRFALTLPDGLTLDSGSSLSMYSPNNIFPNLYIRGQSAIESFLGVPGGDKVLLFPSANVKINVTGDGVGVPDVQVQVSQDGKWIGHQNTNSSGVAEFYSTAPTAALLAQTWLGNSTTALNARFVSTKKDFSASEVANGTSNSVFTGTVALATPNIRGVVRLPSVNGAKGATTNRASIYAYDRDNGEWISGTNPADDGTFALFLKGGCCESRNYTLVVDPYWDASGVSDLVRKEFDVVVSTTNVATISERNSGTAVGTEVLSTVTVSTLVIGTPNVKGSVVNPSGVKVPNVGVEIYGQQNWYGYNTNSIGDFKTSLPNGTYRAQAGVWGSNLGFAKSLECNIEVANAILVNNGANCLTTNGELRLALRAPNFTFTLKNNGSPIQNAHVSVSIGGFHTWTYPDSTGKVSLFVDDAAIAAQSQNEKFGTNTFTPHIYVYPYGQTNGAIQWSCNAGDSKPICSQLGTYTIGTPWADKHLGDVQVLTSNIKIKIVRPVGTESIGEYAYAEIFRIDRGYDEWAGWGRTDSDGFAGFYIETSTALAGARYKVRVTPPWHLRSAFTTKVWDNSTNGYTYDQLNNLQLALGTPNLKVSVVAPNGSTPNKWGWSYIEEVDSNNRGVKWVDSTSLDEFGKTAYILEASKRYRLVAYPAGGRSGSVTSCLIQSDSTTALAFVSGGCVGGTFNTSSEMTLVLARGNVIGTVFSTDGTTPVAGAIIYANIVGATDQKMAITSCTLANGTYGITLDPNYQWEIKIFPVNKPGAAVQLANKNDLAAITPPAIGESTTLNVTLSAKP